MNNWMIVFFAVASGFTAAGILGSLHAVITGSPAGFRLRANPVYALLSFFVVMFAGPYIFARNVLVYRRSRRLPMSLAVFATGICLVWSFCAGVFVVQILLFAGLIHA